MSSLRLASATLLERYKQAIRERYSDYAADFDEVICEPSDEAISRAAQIIYALGSRLQDYDYAFGKDGSIGVYAHSNIRTEYTDILGDGRLRYYLRNVGGENEFDVASGDAAQFLAEHFQANLGPILLVQGPLKTQIQFTLMGTISNATRGLLLYSDVVTSTVLSFFEIESLNYSTSIRGRQAILMS